MTRTFPNRASGRDDDLGDDLDGEPGGGPGDDLGNLLRAKVVPDAGAVLEDALDRRLTGYATLEPRDALLGVAGGLGVLTFERGVPGVAYHTGTERGGPAALADVGPGPYRLELYALAATELRPARESPDWRVSPDLPAERLAGDAALADRTRRAAPADRLSDDGGGPTDHATLEAFLADEERIAAIRDQAREEARSRAEEWGFADALSGGD